MSVKIMSMVFDRYTDGGGEMLLALALADHASNEGENIFPSVKALAEKTRQSERSVQYQLRKMEADGWLILVNAGNGGRNQRREYIISPEWIKGAEIAPLQKGAIHDTKGATTGQKGAIHDTKGCNGVHPHITIKEPSGIINNHEDAQALGVNLISAGLMADFLKVRKAKRAGPLTATALNGIKREAIKAGITLEDAVTACCEFGWQGFNADWYFERKGYAGRQAGRKVPTPQESFAERDARIGREKWEAQTGRIHPENLKNNPQHSGHVVDAETLELPQ